MSHMSRVPHTGGWRLLLAAVALCSAGLALVVLSCSGGAAQWSSFFYRGLKEFPTEMAKAVGRWGQLAGLRRIPPFVSRDHCGRGVFLFGVTPHLSWPPRHACHRWDPHTTLRATLRPANPLARSPTLSPHWIARVSQRSRRTVTGPSPAYAVWVAGSPWELWGVSPSSRIKAGLMFGVFFDAHAIPVIGSGGPFFSRDVHRCIPERDLRRSTVGFCSRRPSARPMKPPAARCAQCAQAWNEVNHSTLIFSALGEAVGRSAAFLP